MTRVQSPSLASEEVSRFSAKAEDWWNPCGPFGMLHQLGPLRLAYIGKVVGKKAFNKLRFLDVGCGGGLLAEALAKQGAHVTGIDPSPELIAVARRHAELSGLAIDYRVSSVEKWARGKQRYDVITAFEVIEHVAHFESFIKESVRLLKPDGLLILATLNRTPQSFLFGILAAEYLLGWVPPGTHDWSKFKRPSELVQRLNKLGLTTEDLTGVVFDPLTGEFHPDAHNLRVNYFLTARKSVKKPTDGLRRRSSSQRNPENS